MNISIYPNKGNRLFYAAILLFFFCQVVLSQNKKIVSDWQEYTFNSKYGNPITILWALERDHQKASWMDNQYHYFIRLYSKTSFNGSPQKVWVGFDIEVKDREYNLSWGQTLS